MGQYRRSEFSSGYLPSADSFKCPVNGLLRMDNLTLDELGAVALRQGSAKVNSTALNRTYGAFDYTSSFETSYFTSASGIAQFTDEWERDYLTPQMPGNGPANHNYTWEVTDGYISATLATDLSVHSLFTTTLSGSRYRMAGATNAVYANSSMVWASLSGSGDVSFGAHMGHILFARGTTRKKFDGSVVRNWGIAAPDTAPTLTAIATDSKTFASCASTEAPIMTLIGVEGSLAFAADKAGTANAAVELTPDTTTGRVVAQKTFASATDFTTYDGGQTGTDDDLIDFYDFVTEPQYMDFITLLIDVNDGTFQEDWYEYTFRAGDAIEVVASAEESLASNYAIEAEDRDRVIGNIEDRNAIQSSFRPDKPVAPAGWNHFNVPRGKMERHGLTSGKNWSTVRAVRVVVQGIAGGSGAAVRFDEIRIIGGSARPLTGKFKAALVAVRNDGVYQALSAPSAFSSEIEVRAQGIAATLAADSVAALDFQVNELWLYLMGGRLNAFYRFAVLTGGPFTGAQTINATSSEITALAADLRMETDNAIPPATIIGIEGPHYDRTLCLTATHIYPSRQRNPDSFSSGEAVRVGDAAETALWIMKLNERLYVGTTRDIYFIDGDWTVLPDGSVNVIKRPLGVTAPPISAAVARGTVNGADRLVYLSGDGWRLLGGELLTAGAVDLLWRGFTRHGVSAVNITGTTARFRVAISKNVLFAITPEGSATTSSTVIHAYHFSKQRWYRFTYTPSWLSIAAEPDGTLIGGESTGFVYTLDRATKQDAGSDIPVVLWTGVDDNGQPFTYKDAQNLQIRLATGTNAATIAFHLNGNSAANSSTTTTQADTDTGLMNMAAVATFTQMQLRITGSFSTFTFRGFQLGYLDTPEPLLLHDTNFIDLDGAGDLQWVRRLWVKAKSPVDLTVTPYWDGTAGTARTISVGAYLGKPYVFPVPLGREDKGRTARIVITSTSPSHVYWIEFEFNSSGKQRQKKFVFKPDEAVA